VVGTRVIALEAVLPASQGVLELAVFPGVVSVHEGLNVSMHMQEVAGKYFFQKLNTTGIEATRQFTLDRVLEVTKESALGSVKLSQNDLACILGQKTSTISGCASLSFDFSKHWERKLGQFGMSVYLFPGDPLAMYEEKYIAGLTNCGSGPEKGGETPSWLAGRGGHRSRSDGQGNALFQGGDAA